MTKREIYEIYPFVMDSAPKTVTRINGREYLYFGGVSYYQLHSHPEVVRAATEATLQYGLSSATSRSTTGMTRLHFDVECKAAEFFGTEDAAYLPSGFLSNLGGIRALKEMRLFDVIFMDEYAHYCNKDGANCAEAPVFQFRNNDIEDLETSVKKNLKAGQKPLIVTDGLFSAFGIMADIPNILKIAGEYDGIIWIDDAHPSGIIGSNGRGTYEFYNLKSHRLFFGSTLSKAFGGFGGIIPGSSEFVGHIRKGGILNGGTQPPAAAAAASLKGLEIVMNNPKMREDLWSNARYLKSGLNSIGVGVEENYFPMAAFVPEKEEDIQHIHRKLLEKDIFIQILNYVGTGKTGALRMVVFSTHTKDQIDYLISALKSIL